MSNHLALRSGNPALQSSTFRDHLSSASEGAMTLSGTVNKTAISLILVTLSAGYSWTNPAMHGLVIPAAIVGFILALVTVFKPTMGHITVPAYAVVQGVFLGVISMVFNAQYPGIVVQAVFLTFGTLGALLLAYMSGLIKATENFKLGVVAATGGIALLYVINMVMSFFGSNISVISSNDTMGIIFSGVVVVIAALNLVLDFDFIEEGAEMGAPKYMEWYGAFGLLVTLIWLYLEILRLLAKLSSRR
ncbi:MAG: Bax inhibitor-1/YccA family protein [Candidatus Marinimicrobia bacterium]|nr:Bax inhibitor-1/YccA family protein [Candidatus Neomarinimicrobiota bacterium]